MVQNINITPQRILEFTGLTLKQKIYSQVQYVENEVEAQETNIIGYVMEEGKYISYIGTRFGTLVKVRSSDLMWKFFIPSRKADMKELNSRLEEFKNSLPQIWVS